MTDFPDIADRAHWRKLFAGQSVQLARHEVDLKDQYEAIQEIKSQNEIKALVAHAEAQIESVLAMFADVRHSVEGIEERVTALAAAHEKLILQLKVRFAELRAKNGHAKEPQT